jgi:hypothetical protein
MRLDDKRPALNHGGGVPPTQSTSSRAMQVVAKAVALIGGVVLLVSALALSLIFFAALIVVGVLIGGYLWWKTRELRKEIRTQFESVRPVHADRSKGSAMDDGIIEGEILGRGAPDETQSARNPPSFRTLE